MHREQGAEHQDQPGREDERRGGVHGHGQDAGQRGADHEADLVQGGVEGQGRPEQAVAAQVGEPTDDRAAEGLAEPERGGDGARGADAVAFGDEHERSARRGGEPCEGRVEGEGAAAEGEHRAQAAVRRRRRGCGRGRGQGADVGEGVGVGVGWDTDNLQPRADPPVSPARAVARCPGP
ncbi:hypothetical protein [Streptomyces erythrochromogenes]|uniref:hypothetical protein n=1 Tax=Streptomyces erythrochromogenes TaxID=285574 RepID=UPI0037F9723F